MMRFRRSAILLAVALGLGGCGTQVVVQPGEVGKELGGYGFKEEVLPPGVQRLSVCWGSSICPKIVRMESGRVGYGFKLDSIFLPESNWDTFGERVVLPSVVVDVLKDMKVEQVMNTGSELSSRVHAAVSKALENTPIEVTELAVVDTDVPDVVMDSKRKLFAIEDDRIRQLKTLEVGMIVEERRRAFQSARATSDARIAAQLGITVAQYMCLKTNERLADAADDKNSTVILVSCGLGSDSGRAVLPLRPAQTEEQK